MKTFQTGHFSKLRLLGTIPGSIKDEQSIHRELKSVQTTGEWFSPTRGLLSTIKKMIDEQLPWYHIREFSNELLVIESLRDEIREISAQYRDGKITKFRRTQLIIPISKKMNELKAAMNLPAAVSEIMTGRSRPSKAFLLTD